MGHYGLLGVTMHQTVLMHLAAATIWAHMRPLLLLCGQNAGIAAAAKR